LEERDDYLGREKASSPRILGWTCQERLFSIFDLNFSRLAVGDVIASPIFRRLATSRTIPDE
jgi:hypothetical protein